MKNILKTNEICYCLGGGGGNSKLRGEIQNLGGEISPPKGPEKNTVYLCVQCTEEAMQSTWIAAPVNILLTYDAFQISTELGKTVEH